MNRKTQPMRAGEDEIGELRLVFRSRRYELGEQIGEGGMGAVFQGRHLLLDRPVAIKLLSSLTRHAKSSFMAEGRALAKLRHPNLVEIYDLDLIGEVPYLVMELLRGETLETRLTERGRLPLAEACAVMRQILRGLGAAHAQGIVHRDVKPANIFLTRGRASTETAKLLDFGISGLVGAAGEASGTAHYFAPEQLRSEALDVRTDLWAFGVTLYETLTGVLPFRGASVESIFASRTTSQSARPS
jgi:eukaryotic-like serine/threonine-protein kinase